MFYFIHLNLLFSFRMPGSGPKYYCCIKCKKRTNSTNRRFISGPAYKAYRKHLGLVSYEDTDVTCMNCYAQFYRKKWTNTVSNVQGNSDPCTTDSDYEPPAKKSKETTPFKSPQIIPLPILSTGKSHSSCCICKARGIKFITLSSDTRHKLFVLTGQLLLAGARCCPVHLKSDSHLTEEAILKLQNNASSSSDSTTYFNKSDIFSLISNIRDVALRNDKYRIDFDSDTGLQDSDYLSLTGISKENFNDLVSYVKSIRATKNRSIRTCIALLLVKLRTGMSNRLLSTLFNIGKSGVRRAVATARKELNEHFTPYNIGFNHITREEVIDKHTRPLAQELFGNMNDPSAILVVDGTYIFIEKSNNFKFQRRSFSLHKNRPLVKPMMIVSTTGYIVSVLGPYHADCKNNDSSILKHNIQSNMENINEWLQQDDIMVVDRGFRDSISFLQDLGIKSEMPCFLKKGQKQHTTEEVIILFNKFQKRQVFISL